MEPVEFNQIQALEVIEQDTPQEIAAKVGKVISILALLWAQLPRGKVNLWWILGNWRLLLGALNDIVEVIKS